MALDNATVLENLRKQRAELETQLENGREMYLKITGAIEVQEQLVQVAAAEAAAAEEPVEEDPVAETEVVE